MDTFLGTTIANIKIATLVVGVINIGFIGHSFLTISSEEAYLSAVIICFIISFLWTMAIIINLISTDTDIMKKAEMVYHMVACVFYLITLIIFFVSLVDKGKRAPYLWERIVSFLLGVGNTILYGFAGYLFYKA
ncbi:unnamed protein product [Orchesella dallaii]|uniref:MARVEL domain-containing protein n=1 Tax=Orchesella dallaii TaxID=48710 RepID=A0ABP1QSB1_9HEXA